MMMFMNGMQSGGNPMQLLQQMADQNPQIFQFMQQLRQMAENMAKEHGTSIEQIAEQIAKQIGFNPPR